jgi:hypothetical protein
MAHASTNEIAKILSGIQDQDNYTVISDFFEMSAIAIRNNVDHGRERDKYEQRYLQIVKKYKREQLDLFVNALAVFSGWIKKAMDGDIPFRDFAGEIYMDSGTSNGKAGQFFTPYHVSKLMAECNFDKDKLKAEIAEDPDRVITIAEPTCGAGGLIVAAIDVLKDAGINYAWNAFVDCGDIDARCVHMTYLTLSLLGVPAVVRRGDALMLDYSETWYTPAYIFAWPHFKSRLRGGKYPATPTVQEVPQEPQTAPVEEIPAVAPVPVPVTDENGQYSLF